MTTPERFTALREACSDYHAKHSTGVGGARVCICGAGGGGSNACGDLSEIRNFFRYAEWGDPTWALAYEDLARRLDA